ncbi:MAG: tyrosine-type recombinase/integrase [Tepidisphaeraceae bacterium]
MPRATTSSCLSFRMGRVQGYLRGRVWYLCYHENGQRRRPRVGASLEAARRVAAQTNAQLESGDATMLTFEPIAIPALRTRWLEHHEHVLRSSIHTISRYRTATDHLLNFLRDVRSVRLASLFTARDAEALVRYLRTIEVAPNGHKNSARRPLLDKGVKYILECCRALFGYAARRRHLSPYAENPFTAIEVDRIPIEQSKPIVLLTPEQEVKFLEACDDWQFPIFLTLMFTGLRPGELCHLLLPDDLDLDARVLRVRNRPQLGWQVKTRSQREIPLVPVLAEVLRVAVGERHSGPVFRQRRCTFDEHEPALDGFEESALIEQAAVRITRRQAVKNGLTRAERARVLRGIWRDSAALKEDRIRRVFIENCKRAAMVSFTAPKCCGTALRRRYRTRTSTRSFVTC